MENYYKEKDNIISILKYHGWFLTFQSIAAHPEYIKQYININFKNHFIRISHNTPYIIHNEDEYKKVIIPYKYVRRYLETLENYF
jgi:hypothetical protein